MEKVRGRSSQRRERGAWVCVTTDHASREAGPTLPAPWASSQPGGEGITDTEEASSTREATLHPSPQPRGWTRGQVHAMPPPPLVAVFAVETWAGARMGTPRACAPAPAAASLADPETQLWELIKPW